MNTVNKTTTLIPEEAIQALRANAGLFHLAGRCLEEEVDAGLLALFRGELHQPLAEAGYGMDESFHNANEKDLLDTLAEEYTGLFVAPGGVNPYASVFESGAMFQAPCDRVAAAYQAAGYDYRHHMSGEFPDHIGTMLAFVGILAEAEADALERGNESEALYIGEQRRCFLLEELGPWAPGWCQRAAEAALHPFYESILALTESLLWLEISQHTDRRKLRELAELNRREPKKLDYNADFRKASGL